MNTIQYINNDFVEGYFPAQYGVKPKIYANWKRSKIGHDIWKQLVNVGIWCQGKCKKEVQARLLYNKEEDKWAAVVLKQHASGAGTKECGDLEPLKRFPGYILFGTLHTHPGSASQSGTDRQDERNQDGVHITLGNLDDDVLDVHVRFIWNGFQYDDHDILDWVEIDPAIPLDRIPSKLHRYLVLVPPEDTSFPKPWKDAIEQGEKKHGKIRQGELALRYGHHNPYGHRGIIAHGGSSGHGHGYYYDSEDDSDCFCKKKSKTENGKVSTVSDRQPEVLKDFATKFGCAITHVKMVENYYKKTNTLSHLKDKRFKDLTDEETAIDEEEYYEAITWDILIECYNEKDIDHLDRVFNEWSNPTKDDIVNACKLVVPKYVPFLLACRNCVSFIFIKECK